ncbi:MAG: MG2 domain-containing protein [Bacteroidales bacterium]|nr:MG2 domain-containing protein [Bacteroidales bacterium]MCM1148148.1 MG2 domain-containing protein [Bacteroidales bacterium]MCM1206564.1 MG2 domain-containing protein [Bacillota bacterium]MCM1510534.1 MG2 domain-containing protein [Clostridium sp.]
MKKIWTILFSLVMSLTAYAADYDNIWKKYCEAVEKDMYQDAQEQLRNIEKLAEKDSVLAAVYHTIKKDYDKALSNPDLLAKEKSTPWKRIINKGTDDELWNEDLLSIIGHQAGRYSFLKHYYDSIGNRKAACVELYLEVLHFNSRNDDMSRTTKRRMLKEGMKKYQDLEEVALLAQEDYSLMYQDNDISRLSCYTYLQNCISKFSSNKYLNFFKNKLNDITFPRFEFTLNRENTMLIVRNISTLDIEFLPLNCTGAMSLSTYNTADLAKLKKLVKGKAVCTISRDYSSPNPWEEVKDTVETPRLPVGMYLVKASADGLTTYQVFYNSDITLLTLPTSKKNIRIAAVSTTTGKELPSCSIVLTQESDNKTIQTYTAVTDKQGEIIFKGNFKPNYIYAYTTHDKAFHKTRYSNNFHYHEYKEKKDILELFTDRAIYRPGQTIKGCVVAYNASNTDSIRTIAGKQINITIKDAEYKAVHTDSVITDSHGNAGFEFTMPDRLERNGNFTITAQTATDISATNHVRVEEYKRPTFEVNVIDDKTKYADHDSTYFHGDSVAVAFEAKTFTQIPVSNATVEYTIKRRARFYRFGESRIIAENVKVTTDSEGKIIIPLHIILPEEGFGMFVYEITAKVTGKDGESREARANVMARIKSPGSKDYTAGANNGNQHSNKPLFKVSAKSFPHEGSILFTVTDSLSEKPLYVRGAFFADGKCIMKGTFTVRGSYSKELSYKKEYGDNLTIRCIAVRDGKTYQFDETITRPQPDLTLTPVWTTFRDRTQPGAMETWSLRILSGKKKSFPASTASMIATVYDKSLDLETRHRWSIQVMRDYAFLNTSWRAIQSSSFFCSKYATVKNLTEKFINYACFRPELLAFSEEDMDFSTQYTGRIIIRGRQPLAMAMAKTSAVTAKPELSKAIVVGAYNAEATKEASSDMANDEGGYGNKHEDLSTLVRTDLGETAYFNPSLVAGKDGSISMSFRMPETMTTWRFLGLVHDDMMRHAFIDTTCVAKKDIIVKPNVPRFFRNGDRQTGDRPVFASTVSNTTDNTVTANVIMQLLTADAGTVIWEKKTSALIGANSSEAVALETPAITFQDSVLIFRIVGTTANGASDGEQHYIPVLPAVSETTATIAFTQRGDSNYATDISDLLINGSTDRKMTVRFTANAERVVLDAIPHITRPEHKDALSLATAVYVGSMYPAQTPDTLVKSLTDELRGLQLSDGSWSWWEGMNGSAYMTASITRYLARLQHKHLGTKDTEEMLGKAMPYLLNTISEEVKNIRKRKHSKGIHPSELAIDILYICALQRSSGKTFGRQAEADIKYLVGLLEKVPSEFTVYGKAHSAIILALYGKKAKALEFIESMKQYSVYTPEAGRYYDTRKAYYSWRNYKIPTEVAAIEAMRMVRPDDVKTVEEMQQWLLHEKRTQQWDNSANTADAVWAFIYGNNDIDLSQSISGQLTFGGKEIKDGDTVDIEPGRTIFSSVKDSKGTAWGGLLITQRAPLSSVKTTGTGFSVKREIVGNSSPATGDKVTVRLTVTADCDYDFVKVTDNRAACLEPVRQTSGYQAAKTGGTARGSWSGYYRETKDTQTNYYFDKMAKGTHIIETEYYTDREGKYQQGICTVSCAYAPEFSATEALKVMEVQSNTDK